jgi:glycolate oxidase subunit GlcD
MPPIPGQLLQRLQRQLQPGELLLEPARLAPYASDKWFARRTPDAVALPRSSATVAKLLAFAHRHRIPVTPRGAGHGYVGGCVPARGGIVLSLEKLDRILEIHPRDFVAVVQAGAITATLQAQVEKQGLFYPPDPASRANNSIGGNIATNAGGPRCLKYGVTRDYVLGLEVALADGTLLRLGGRTHKNKTGFDLHRLFVGSEGMLGVVTEATLKLLPLPQTRAVLAVGFRSPHAAIQSLHDVLEAGFLPAALEIADAFTLAAAYQRTGSERLRGCHAHLIVEVDGRRRSVQSELNELMRIVRRNRPAFLDHGLGNRQCEAVWRIRREFSYALRDTGLTKLNEDVVVPRGRLQDLFAFARTLRRRHGLAVACFGHAGDGNIHVNVMVDDTQPGSQARAKAALDDLFAQVLHWGGSITGEHGVGLAKKRWWPQAVSAPARKLHRTVKHALDPKGILNPGKFL